jgi:L,D-transpeptidase ErfK/SrfK
MKIGKGGRAFSRFSSIPLGIVWASVAFAGSFEYRDPASGTPPETWNTVVGFEQVHTVSSRETLLDIARHYGLGFNEMALLYPGSDPWIPEPGSELAIPTRWVLPPTKHEGIVINLPEMRLYRFFPKIHAVKTYPIGIGAGETPTPEGTSRVVDRSIYPTWVIPDSLRWKYPVVAIPPGPDNPLGKYWLGISTKGYGIHGTNFPWCVGRCVSNGCMRLYPEDIEQLFAETPVGTWVEIIYEPVKVGFRQGQVFVEVHPDVYGRIHNMEDYAVQRLEKVVSLGDVSFERLRAALQECNGVPVAVGSLRGLEGSENPLVWNDGRARSPDQSIN